MEREERVSGKKLNYCFCLIRAVDRCPSLALAERHLPALSLITLLPHAGRGGKGVMQASLGSASVMIISGIDHHIYL